MLCSFWRLCNNLMVIIHIATVASCPWSSLQVNPTPSIHACCVLHLPKFELYIKCPLIDSYAEVSYKVVIKPFLLLTVSMHFVLLFNNLFLSSLSSQWWRVGCQKVLCLLGLSFVNFCSICTNSSFCNKNFAKSQMFYSFEKC